MIVAGMILLALCVGIVAYVVGFRHAARIAGVAMAAEMKRRQEAELACAALLTVTQDDPVLRRVSQLARAAVDEERARV